MRPFAVVEGSPLFDQYLGLLEHGEDLHVQALVPELSIEALVVSILPGAVRPQKPKNLVNSDDYGIFFDSGGGDAVAPVEALWKQEGSNAFMSLRNLSLRFLRLSWVESNLQIAEH
jgi:hypothetical protein